MDSLFLYAQALTILVFHYHIGDVTAHYGQTEILSKHKHAVKTYENKYGDIFDCVSIYQQPSLNHPLLKNHTIQTSPPKHVLKNAQCTPKRSKVQNDRNVTHYCPKGTIPIIRSKKYDVNIQPNVYSQSLIHREYAHVGTRERHYSSSVTGAAALLDIHHPHLAVDNDYSLAQVSLVSSFGKSDHISIEAGWMVDEQSLISTTIPRFFIRWTGDEYSSTGCFNLQCPGFIQTNFDVEIGGVMSELIEDNILSILIHQADDGNWWLSKDCVPVGYWHVFFIGLERLGYGAEQALFGGEVVYKRVNNRHTHTEMGNGVYIPVHHEQEEPAAIRYLQVRQGLSHTPYVDLQEHEYYMNKPNCYNAQIFNPPTGGLSMYYGGPGYDRYRCP